MVRAPMGQIYRAPSPQVVASLLNHFRRSEWTRTLLFAHSPVRFCAPLNACDSLRLEQKAVITPAARARKDSAVITGTDGQGASLSIMDMERSPLGAAP